MTGRLPSVCAIQVGARLHYAAPAALARAGVLCALVTDATEAAAGGPVASVLGRLAPRISARMKGRKIPRDIPADTVRSFLFPSIEIAIADRIGPKIAKSARKLHRLGVGSHRLSKIAVEHEFWDADTLYVHPCTSTDAIRRAKQVGLRVVVEAISHPYNKRVEFAEFARYGLTPDQSAAQIEDNIAFFKAEATDADVILAASPFVRAGLLELGLSAERIRIVRYGLDEGFFACEMPQPVPGRVLYVGTVNYLKGVPILAEAARLLAKSKSSGIQVDAVGPIAPGLAARSEFDGPVYHGQVPRSVVRRYFAGADVFAFPTLSDGFGLVLLEAMAAGLPVVCTANCADLVRHGENGLLVPVHDPHALAEAIRTIVEDRALREQMSQAARETARRHTLADYTRDLTAAITAGLDAGVDAAGSSIHPFEPRPQGLITS